MALTHLDLFSGIGGFSLGLEKAGFRTIAFCEIEPFCQGILRQHWPDVAIYEDVNKLCRRLYDCEPENEDGEVICPRCGIDFGDCDCIGTDQFTDTHGHPTVITGGFPCQDISVGHTWQKAKGIEGARSALWWQFARIIGELEPEWVVVENVAALRNRGLDAVLQSLNALGYVGEWHVISAAALGAEHERERVWIIAHHKGLGVEGLRPDWFQKSRSLVKPFLPLRDSHGEWQIEPDICRANDGFPRKMDCARLKAIGNAVVPAMPELIGYAIREAMNGN